MVTSTIQSALRGEDIVGLADVRRGEKGLTCCVCGGRLRVCDGKGERVKGKGSRNVPKRKYFAHVGDGGCYGEGQVHFIVKNLFAAAITHRIERPNGFMGMPYVCPALEYAPNCIFKHAPGQDSANPELQGMDRGYHYFDLLENLHEVKCEHWLGGRATRGDIVGLDHDGNPLWVIEIKRKHVSEKAVQYAEASGYPLFIVDVTSLPSTDDAAERPVYVNGSMDLAVLIDNTRWGGFLHYASETYNVACERQAFGMGPTDTHWNKQFMYVCRAAVDCGSNGCPECEEVLLHECGGDENAMVCPDTWYMFRHEIGPVQMYTDPIHAVHSHTYAGEI